MRSRVVPTVSLDDTFNRLTAETDAPTSRCTFVKGVAIGGLGFARWMADYWREVVLSDDATVSPPQLMYEDDFNQRWSG